MIVYVAPSGAGASSAGVFITMAAHVAAMAPGTNIGAAHPVGGQGEDIDGEMGEKVENFTASFSEAIARQRGRNVEWAEKAVRESVSMAADEAAKQRSSTSWRATSTTWSRAGNGPHGRGRRARRARSISRRRSGPTATRRVVDYEMRLAQRVLNVLADPNIAYLLMMAGLLGLYVEFTHPGVVLPGRGRARSACCSR